MDKQLSENNYGLFKRPDEQVNTRLSSIKSWSKQPLAAKIYQKGCDVCPVQTELTIDLNTRSNQELPAPLSKLERATEKISSPDIPVSLRKTTRSYHTRKTIIADYKAGVREILRQNGINPYDYSHKL
jgi:hypothetical protein